MRGDQVAAKGYESFKATVEFQLILYLYPQW